jgi:rhamnogalacturonyl hydrolase YesR
MIYGCLAGDPSTRKYQPAVLQVAQYWRQNTMTADGFWHLEKKEYFGWWDINFGGHIYIAVDGQRLLAQLGRLVLN